MLYFCLPLLQVDCHNHAYDYVDNVRTLTENLILVWRLLARRVVPEM